MRKVNSLKIISPVFAERKSINLSEKKCCFLSPENLSAKQLSGQLILNFAHANTMSKWAIR